LFLQKISSANATMKHINLKPAFVFFLVLAFAFCNAQQQKISLRDSVDNAFDLSDYIIHANGFVPVPYILTEPALGGFGIAIAPIFLKQKPPFIDSAGGKAVYTPVAPDITGGIGLYTVNGSWLTAVFKRGTLIKSRIKYTIGGAYGDINMAFYRTIPQLGEKKFEFSIKTLPVFLQSIKRISRSNWYAGIKYLFLKADVEYKGDSSLTPDFVKPQEYSSTISQLGAVIELDNRDNVFTPDNGIKLHFDAECSDNVLGSDYDYWRLNYYMYAYRQLSSKVVGGLRVDGQQAFSEPPFFMLPYVNMRGIATYRYQGNATLVSEAEFRWDFIRRWSLMLYGGTAKAFDEWNIFGQADWLYSYGTGFRYLIAKKFKLRMGVDVARGPEEFAYYIVFGSNWIK
jgi:hypothetical protein